MMYQSMPVALLLPLLPCAGAQTASAPAHDTAPYDAVLEGVFPAQGPGGVVLVARGTEILYHRAFGLASVELGAAVEMDTRFRIASLTKPIVAAAVERLVEKGELAMDDPLSKFFPGYPDADTIQIEHLLAHSSGLHNYNNFREDRERGYFSTNYSAAERVERFQQMPHDFAPGERYAYSNTGYFLLGEILAMVSGQLLGHHLEDAVFTPLGMERTSLFDPRLVVNGRASGYFATGQNILLPADDLSRSLARAADGGVESTAMDLFRFCRGLMGGELISAEALRAASVPYRMNDGTFGRVGHAWFPGTMGSRSFITHDGLMAGFTSSLIVFPDEEVVAILLSNCNWYRASNSADFPAIPLRLAAVALGAEYLSAAGPTEARAARFEGVYGSASGARRTLQFRGGQLMMLNPRWGWVPLHPMGEGAFLAESSYETISFGPGIEPAESLTSTCGVPTTLMRLDVPLPTISVTQAMVAVMQTSGTDAGLALFERRRKDPSYYLDEAELHRAGPILLDSGSVEQAMAAMALAEDVFPASERRATTVALRAALEGRDGAAVLRDVLAQEGVARVEAEINRAGYALLHSGHVDQAIAFFRAGRDLFPTSWNAHDSLGEALLSGGDREGARACYRRAVELNPEHWDGYAALAELR